MYTEHLFRTSRQPDAPRLSVVVPIRNEAGNVQALFDALECALVAVDHEVVVVDDSTDGETRRELSRVACASPAWMVIERPPGEQTGLATAVAVGITAATGEAVCVMDGDLQHPPPVVPTLLDAVEAGADLAVASRYADGGASDGLSGGPRRMVSRGSTLAARLVFPEARRTSDPLSGFFCVRRSVVAGLELRPVGFKILLELLVLCPDLAVVDVPFAFAERRDGESKASVRQGVLYLRHLASLFLYVPRSSRTLKFALGTGVSLAIFVAIFAALGRLGLPPVAAWLVASIASSVTNAVIQRTLALGSRGGKVYRALGAGGTAAGLGLYAAAQWVSGAHPMLVGTAVQALALAVPLGIAAAVRGRLDGWTASLGHDLADLAARLHADRAWWVDATGAAGPADMNGSSPEVADLVRRAADSQLPDLLVRPASPVPQPRRNVEVLSVIVVPDVRPGHVAVLVRRQRTPFVLGDLEEAVRWGHANRDAEAIHPRGGTG
jgi:dolichol-phosphate mannosyltransferase